MPPVLLAIPAAAALAYWLLRGGPLRRRPRDGAPPGDAGDGLAPGATGRLAPGEEEPYKRRELPFREEGGGGEQPTYTGGEYGGGYGPEAGEGGDGGGYAEPPPATQTSILMASSGFRESFGTGPTTPYSSGVREAFGSGPTTPYSSGFSAPSGPTTYVSPAQLLGGSAPAPAPAPVPVYQPGTVVGGGSYAS